MKLPAALLLSLSAIAHADVIAFDNLGPLNSYDAFNSWLVHGPQSATPVTQAFRFTSSVAGDITRLTIPLRHSLGPNLYRFEIYSDDVDTPGTSLGIIGTSPGFVVATPPPPPVVVIASASVHLQSGVMYWLVASCDSTTEGYWNENAADSDGLHAYDRYDGGWLTNDGPLGAFRLEVSGAPACYANCDQSTAPPILNVNDFQCFLNHFATGDPSANCDNSTTPPILNVNDFQCFLNTFAAGCS